MVKLAPTWRPLYHLAIPLMVGCLSFRWRRIFDLYPVQWIKNDFLREILRLSRLGRLSPSRPTLWDYGTRNIVQNFPPCRRLHPNFSIEKAFTTPKIGLNRKSSVLFAASRARFSRLHIKKIPFRTPLRRTKCKFVQYTHPGYGLNGQWYNTQSHQTKWSCTTRKSKPNAKTNWLRVFAR